jgi:hypothetical protein
MRLRSSIPFLLLPVLCTSCWVDKYGVLGANFRLSGESRFPCWFKNVSGIPAKDLNVKVWTYENGNARVFISRHGFFDKTVQEGVGSHRWHPESLKEEHPGLRHPWWIIIKINGSEEVYESRGSNDILWIVDKPIPK